MKKITKLFLIMAACTLLSACGQKKKATPILTKNQVIKKAQKAAHSGEAIQTFKIKTATSSNYISSDIWYGGNPLVLNIVYQQFNSNGNQSNKTSMWVNSNGIAYIHGQKWYKTNLVKFTGHNFYDFYNASSQSPMLVDPADSLIKAYKMKRQGQTYTLTATIKDKSILDDALNPILNTASLGTKQQEAFNNFLKKSKFKNITVKLVYKNGQLASFNYTVHYKLQIYQLELSQQIGNQGKQDMLTMPQETGNAVDLPTNKNSKSNQANKNSK
ncbi:MAG: hypothetical protein Q3960_03740 [Lactobacillus sp.]|nr:hypothetical protein [Lactobacillus sp.]